MNVQVAKAELAEARRTGDRHAIKMAIANLDDAVRSQARKTATSLMAKNAAARDEFGF